MSICSLIAFFSSFFSLGRRNFVRCFLVKWLEKKSETAPISEKAADALKKLWGSRSVLSMASVKQRDINRVNVIGMKITANIASIGRKDINLSLRTFSKKKLKITHIKYIGEMEINIIVNRIINVIESTCSRLKEIFFPFEGEK